MFEGEIDPRDPRDQPEYNYECSYCGEPSEQYFCSRECKIAELND